MKMSFFISICLLLLIGCRATEKSVLGSYKSNYKEHLVLNSDRTFTIDYKTSDSLAEIVKGQWTLKNKIISLKVSDSKDKKWECWGLKIKHNKLKRPVDCGPSHRFIFFTKEK